MKSGDSPLPRVKRTIVIATVVGALLAYAFLAGGVIDASTMPGVDAEASGDTPRSHDVQVRSLGADEASVTVTVRRHGSTIMDREVSADDSFSHVLRLQGTGAFTVVVSTAGDSTSVELDRPAHFANCTGDVILRFSVEADAVYLSTDREPGDCPDS